MQNVVWYGDQVTAKIQGHVANRLQYAARALVNFIRKQLSSSGGPSSAGGAPMVGGVRVAGPPAPGGWPHKQTGHLRRNVQQQFDRIRMTARVGTNVLYGKFLEFGTKNMAARPWLSRALREFRSQLVRILERRVE